MPVHLDPVPGADGHPVPRHRQVLAGEVQVEAAPGGGGEQRARCAGPQSARRRGAQLAQGLDVAQGTARAVAQVPVVDAQRLLEHHVVGVAWGDGDEERAVVHHVVAAYLSRPVRQARGPARPRTRGAGLRTQQQRRRVDRAAGQDEAVRADTQLTAFVLGQRLGDPPSGRAGDEPGDRGPGEQRDVAGGQRGPQRAHVGVALGLDQAGKAVAGAAAQAPAVLPEVHAGGQGERGQALVAQRRGERGDGGFVRYGRPGVVAGAPRVGRVGGARAVHPVEAFGARVVRFERAVRERPAGRDALGVLQRPEVGLAEARQGGAEDLGVPADVVVHARGEEPPGRGVVPGFGVAVARGGEDVGRRPVLPFPRQEVAALHDQDPRAGAAQGVRQGRAAHAGAEHGDVAVEDGPGGAQQAARAPRGVRGWCRCHSASSWGPVVRRRGGGRRSRARRP